MSTTTCFHGEIKKSMNYFLFKKKTTKNTLSGAMDNMYIQSISHLKVS